MLAMGFPLPFSVGESACRPLFIALYFSLSLSSTLYLPRVLTLSLVRSTDHPRTKTTYAHYNTWIGKMQEIGNLNGRLHKEGNVAKAAHKTLRLVSQEVGITGDLCTPTRHRIAG